MESQDQLKVVITVACFAAAISIFFTSQYRKHIKQQKHKQSQAPCYLKTETKPQDVFKRVLADNSYSPFKHLKLKNGSGNDNFSNLHPYRDEIASLLKRRNVDFKFFNGEFDSQMSDSYVWVETELQLKELVDVLSEDQVFAVDTEQHSFRSFLGFTALIQISTKDEDYLVDTIALRDAMGIFRPVFANSNICKVFHGADNDVLWLQRDFHIYVVNLFDTAKVCDMLSKPQKSLAYLLETYCGVSTNKMLQREDWRQRPLTKEMVQYARMDAHYLLYIAHCLVSELKQQDSETSALAGDNLPCVLEAIRRSNATSLQLYSKEIEVFPGESAASSMISRHLNEQGSSSIFHDTKFQELARRLCAWRDLMARIHDESLRFVLSDHAILGLVHKVPTTETDIYDTISQVDLNADSINFISSLQSPFPVVCSHWEDLFYLFQEEIDNPEDIFQLILRKHLGPNGSCPLSIYNYALLSKTNLKLTNGSASRQNGLKNARQVARKASRELFVQKFSCKAPVYHNCRIFANDGRLLCYCDRRKLEWYLHRDLAKLLDDNPPAIILLFEPKGRPEDEGNDFYIQSKKNICVSCGEGNHYLRYRIIPSCYRMHFPEHLKSHRSHDIVLLCVDCHEIAHTAAEKHKKQIAAEFDIPLYIRKVVDSSQSQDTSSPSASAVNFEEAGVSPLQLRTAAMALLRHGPRMPPERREELTQIVMKYYGGREISEEDLERALLVGMSPHERRRLEKKKGLSFKHSMKNLFPEKELHTSSGNGTTEAAENTSNIDNINDSRASNGEAGREEDCHLLVVSHIDVEASAVDSNIKNSDASLFSEIKDSDPFDDVNTRRALNATVDSVHPSSNGTFSANRNSKLSLLGHGPHGKQVVDLLLKEYGEEGICQFCQRWRQVFVEAVRPRFLPAGWDVMHSGRREFGKYSVYNPANKGSDAS